MPAERRHARILAMQALCQWEVQRDTSSESLQEFLAGQQPAPDVLAYATGVIESFWKQQELVDQQISAATEKWEFSRISTVERNVMRVAVVELFDRNIPPKVALNEAIEIGREYGGGESPRFINGVLDRILRALPGGE
ncbi:MAG: transcription antitermination factor NusB [Planctomycetes bacterium]|nr:transcription antitermination factor NusB [Planctomycetota bacterium]